MFAGIAVIVHAAPPILIVLANHFLWPWATRSANIGWAVWVAVMGSIMALALAASFFVGMIWRGSRPVRAMIVAGGLVGQSAVLLLIARG